jgi:citrate synthase
VLASAGDALRGDLATPVVVAQARSLIATMATLAVPGGRDARSSRLVVQDGHGPRRGTVAGLLWGRLAGARPTPGLVAALNGALVLLADHELAASTLAARVAASARADPYSVVLAGLGPLSGPLHGAASRFAYGLLEAAAAEGPDRAIARSLEIHPHLPGFGHILYPDGDPRARVLVELVRSAEPGCRPLAVADGLVATARRRARLEPNIDLALAVLAAVARMPAEAGEVIFTIARTAGWIAHAIEEYGEQPLRFRPRSVFRGAGSPPPRDDGSLPSIRRFD